MSEFYYERSAWSKWEPGQFFSIYKRGDFYNPIARTDSPIKAQLIVDALNNASLPTKPVFPMLVDGIIYV